MNIEIFNPTQAKYDAQKEVLQTESDKNEETTTTVVRAIFIQFEDLIQSGELIVDPGIDSVVYESDNKELIEDVTRTIRALFTPEQNEKPHVVTTEDTERGIARVTFVADHVEELIDIDEQKNETNTD